MKNKTTKTSNDNIKNTISIDNEFNRRTFINSSIKTGLSVMAGGFLLSNSRSALSAEINEASDISKKTWAQQNLRGGEAFILPSLKKNLKTLDEEGIRRDVRHSIAQGFCSIMPLPLGIDSKTEQHMQTVIADEAKGKILTVGIIRPGSWQEKKKSVREMEGQGVSHVLMYFNPELATQEAMYRQMLEIINNTSLRIVLYAKPSNNITHLDPTGIPLDTFDKLANHDNVVGVKFTQTLRPLTCYGIAERLGDRLLLGVVDLEIMLALSAKYKMQWTGQWGIDSLQSPETPWVNQFLDLLRTGKNQQAYELYWRYEPIASNFFRLQEPSLRIGGHPWLHIKYMKWLTGGNGGLLADLNESTDFVPHLDPQGRAQCREIFHRVGIKIVDLPDDAFVVGNAAYERGVRPKDLPALPQYVA
ncbi:hypothetical protein NBRC116493_23070 [Aurantivibrio infirmus]